MLKIEFGVGNAAFRYEDGIDNYEVARIIEDIATKIKNGITYGKVIDYNGNYVGDWRLDDYE